MATDLAKAAKRTRHQVFPDLLHRPVRHACAPSWCRPPRSAGWQKNGAGFAGFATWLDMTPADPDLFAMPDPDSLIQLPWKPEVGWLAADLWMDGKPVEQAPRNVLKRVDRRRRRAGLRDEDRRRVRVLPDLARRRARSPTPPTRQAKPCYDQSALMRRYDVITRDLRRHAGARLGRLPERPRGRQRPVRDELGLRRRADHRRPPRLLQVHGASRSPRSTACARPSCRSRSPT